MKKYEVTIEISEPTQREYIVEAESEDEAKEKAYRQNRSELYEENGFDEYMVAGISSQVMDVEEIEEEQA